MCLLLFHDNDELEYIFIYSFENISNECGSGIMGANIYDRVYKYVYYVYLYNIVLWRLSFSLLVCSFRQLTKKNTISLRSLGLHILLIYVSSSADFINRYNFILLLKYK